MNKFAAIITSLTLLVIAGCSTPAALVDTQTSILILPADNNAALYYTADEITQLGNCALRARQAEIVAQEKLDGKLLDQIKTAHADDKNIADNQALIDQAFTDVFFSKNDFAMKVFKTCAITNTMTDKRANRAVFCMSNQFVAEYIWNAKQQGISDKEVRHRLAESGNKAVPLITREIYKQDTESLDNARARLWGDCIHNFKQVK